ncbi:MAG: transglutaminase domain-containing protein [Traorella sp.]
MKTNKYYPFIIYLLACLTPFYVFFIHFDVNTFQILIYPLCLIITLSFFFIKGKYRQIIFLLLIFGIILILFINQTGFYNALYYFYNGVVKAYNSYTNIGFSLADVTLSYRQVTPYVILLTSLIQIIICILSYFLIYKFNQPFLLFIMSLIFTLPCLVVQMELNWIMIIFLFIYWMMLFIPTGNSKIKTNIKVQFRQAILIIITISISSCIFLNTITSGKVEKIYSISNDTQDIIDKINDYFKNLSSFQSNSTHVNLKNAKNRYFTSAVHIEVTREKKEALYLKYYSGAIYQNSSWNPLDKEIYERISENELINSFTWIRNPLYYNYNNYEEIHVIDYRKGTTLSLYPYNLKEIDQDYDTYYDVYLNYNQKDVTFEVWNKANEGYTTFYTSFVKKYYRDVPSDIATFFKKEFGLDEVVGYGDVEEAKEIVLNILKEYQYTLSPGSTPDDEDFVIYFLGQNKKGYCVHFATAATLLFRYLGVPARYVDGYYIEASQFDENNHCEVLDSDAHAWVEVFDNKSGWRPIEVSVGYTSNKLPTNEPDKKDEPEPENPTQQPSQTPTQKPNNTPDIDLPSLDDDTTSVKSIENLKYGIIFVGIWFVLWLIYQLRKMIQYKKFTQKDIRKGVYAMYRYVEKVSKTKDIMSEEWFALFEKNRFSKEGLTDKERYDLLSDIHQKVNQLYQTLPFYKKIIFKYIQVLK